jgi:hypothetical protein
MKQEQLRDSETSLAGNRRVLGSVLLAEHISTSWPLLTSQTGFEFRNAVQYQIVVVTV